MAWRVMRAHSGQPIARNASTITGTNVFDEFSKNFAVAGVVDLALERLDRHHHALLVAVVAPQALCALLNRLLERGAV